ncbi:restriction endonuclease subunit S [Bacillus luti]|uniref:restriction endonuclease subunit S n=1 Tax=Bacillus luti TaxID=2026191 RepID=UPI002A2B75E8|nr:restriction endonuclease subunit S [Bacillus cereus]MDA2103635.1 restriction endonuclease subunit S [Bacillus cereus]
MEKIELGKITTYIKGKPPVLDAIVNEEVVLLSPEYLRGTAEPVRVAKTQNLVMVNENEILLLWDGSNAGEFFLSKKGALASTMVKINVEDDDFIKDYLFYSLKAFEGYLKGQTNGSGIPHVDKEILNAHKVIKFDKQEQEKIVEVLYNTDLKIKQTNDLINKYNRIKVGMMQELLSRGIDERGNIRSEETHEFKDSSLGSIPVEWNVEKLELHLEKIEQGWSPQCDFEPAGTGEWGVLKTTAVTWNGYNQNENKRLPVHLVPRPQYEVVVDDVLMTRGGPNSRVGVVSFVEETRDKLILSDKLYRLTPKKHLNPRYLAWALSSDATQRHLSTMKTGMAESQTNISQEIVKNLFIKVMGIEEQDRMIKLLRLTEECIKGMSTELAKLKKVKEGLMQDLLTGEVRVTDLILKDVGI